MTAVNHPDHYQHPSGIECVDISRHLPHALASAFEYVWRWRHKGGVEDLRKARWWLNDWLAHSQPFSVPGHCYRDLSQMRDVPDFALLCVILDGDAKCAIDLIDETIAEMVDDA